MTEPLTLNELAGWLSRASMTPSADELALRQDAVDLIRARMDPLDLVSVAYGIQSEALVLVEAILAETDSSWLSGQRTELVTRVAGAAAISVLRDDGARGTITALATRSAEYLGYSPAFDEVSRTSAQILFEAATRSRARSAFSALGTKPKRLLLGEVDLDGEEGVQAVRVLARRFEEIVSAAQERIDQMDEELDTLWWARRDRSNQGETWADMEIVSRSVDSTLEVLQLVTRFPPAHGTVEVLLDAIGDVDEANTSLGQVASRLLATPLAKSKTTHRLLPLASATSTLSQYAGDVATASAVLNRATGLTLETEVSLRGLPEQILREASILELDGA